MTTLTDTIDMVKSRYPPSKGISRDVSGIRFAKSDKKTVWEIKIEIDNVSNKDVEQGEYFVVKERWN